MADRPYVVSVESNLKTGGKFELGRRTLILGDTGAGKSAITNAVELALSGRASDIRGREDVAQAAILIALAPGRKGLLYAEATLSDGTKARWETTAAAKGSAKTPTHTLPLNVDPKRVLPLRAVKDAVVAEADAARRKFLGWIAGDVTHADVERLIPAMLMPKFKSLLVGATPSDTPVDRLLFVTERARKEAKDASARANAAEKMLEGSNIGSTQGPPSDADVTAAQDALTQANADMEKATRAESKYLAAKRAQSSRLGAETELAKYDKEIAELEAQNRGLLVEDGTVSRAIEAIREYATPLGPVQQGLVHIVAKQAEGVFGAQCVVCLSSIPVDTFRARNVEVQGMAQSRIDAQRQVAEMTARREVLLQTMGSNKSKAEQIAYSRNTLKTTIDNFISNDAVTAPPDMDAVRATVNAAQTHVQTLIAHKSSWESTLRARDATAAERATHNEWKQLETACDTAVEQLLDGHVKEVETKVQAKLPPGLQFGLQLRDGARGVFEIGFMRGGILNSALSGGEWAMMTTALADAFAPPVGPSVIVPFDRQMDPATLQGALKAWSASDSQIIVTSVIEPAVIPEGWTVIRMGAKRAQPALDSTVIAGAAAALAQVPAAPAEPKVKKLRKKKGETDEAYAARCAAPPEPPKAKTPVERGICACGTALTADNSSLKGTKVTHIGCQKIKDDEIAAEAAAVLAGPIVTAMGGKLKLYDVAAPAKEPEDGEPFSEPGSGVLPTADPNGVTI